MTTKLGVVALTGPDNGGMYQYTLSMLQALRHTSDFEITLFADPKNPDYVRLGYPISPFAESRAQQLGALTAHRMGISLPDPFPSQDVLLVPSYALSLLHTSKPFAYTLHDLQEHYYPENFLWWQRIWRHQVYAQLLGRARRVICESQYVRNDITRFFGVSEERIAVMPAPPLREFQADQDDSQLQAVRARLKLPEDFLFYPAQFWPHKNHLRLVEAFREVVAEVPNLHLVLIGKKRDQYAAVMSAVDKMGLSGRVHYLGYVEQDSLGAIYRLATALIMPSLFESVSIPIYEAFQVGTPVAASGILGIPEQVGDAGLLFDPTSVASIRQVILEIARDPEAARRLGQKGRERMRVMTPERYGRQLQNLLSTL
jgi:glycosyltransferase involved in cell wall biosynthesis